MNLPEHNKVFTERVGHRVYTESQVQALVDRINELEKVLRWMDRWLGSKPLLECADKIRAAMKESL